MRELKMSDPKAKEDKKAGSNPAKKRGGPADSSFISMSRSSGSLRCGGSNFPVGASPGTAQSCAGSERESVIRSTTANSTGSAPMSLRL